MMSDAHEDALAPVPPQPVPVQKPRKLIRREERRKRRKARRRNEEILAWILVPLIVFGLWWGISAGFEFFGTTPGQVWDQAMQVKKMLEKKM